MYPYLTHSLLNLYSDWSHKKHYTQYPTEKHLRATIRTEFFISKLTSLPESAPHYQAHWLTSLINFSYEIDITDLEIFIAANLTNLSNAIDISLLWKNSQLLCGQILDSETSTISQLRIYNFPERFFQLFYYFK